jgi:hypothetical protein
MSSESDLAPGGLEDNPIYFWYIDGLPIKASSESCNDPGQLSMHMIMVPSGAKAKRLVMKWSVFHPL